MTANPSPRRTTLERVLVAGTSPLASRIV